MLVWGDVDCFTYSLSLGHTASPSPLASPPHARWLHPSRAHLKVQAAPGAFFEYPSIDSQLQSNHLDPHYSRSKRTMSFLAIDNRLKQGLIVSPWKCTHLHLEFTSGNDVVGGGLKSDYPRCEGNSMATFAVTCGLVNSFPTACTS